MLYVSNIYHDALHVMRC